MWEGMEIRDVHTGDTGRNCLGAGAVRWCFRISKQNPQKTQEEKSTALYKCSQNMPRDVHWKAFYPIFCLHIKDVFQVCRFSEKPNW